LVECRATTTGVASARTWGFAGFIRGVSGVTGNADRRSTGA
jgi:hypothetical protein